MATTETRVESSNNPDNRLTCVPLFRYTQPEMAQSRNFYETMAKFSSDYRRSKEYWEAKAQETKKLRERMEANTYQTSLELVTCTSFVTSGMAYLKFLDNFYPELSNGQIFNFFKLCLEINTQGSQIYEVNEAEAERISMRDRSPDFIQKQMMPLLQKAMHHIPVRGQNYLHKSFEDKYHKFEGILWGNRVLKASKPLQNDLFLEEEAQAIAELEDELIQTRVDNLTGWKITYSAGQTTYPSHLIEIPGESIGEMSNGLSSLFVKLGTPNSIKVVKLNT